MASNAKDDQVLHIASHIH